MVGWKREGGGGPCSKGSKGRGRHGCGLGQPQQATTTRGRNASIAPLLLVPTDFQLDGTADICVCSVLRYAYGKRILQSLQQSARSERGGKGAVCAGRSGPHSSVILKRDRFLSSDAYFHKRNRPMHYRALNVLVQKGAVPAVSEIPLFTVSRSSSKVP